MALRDEVKPNFLQRTYRRLATYAMPGSSLTATLGVTAAAVGVIVGAPVVAAVGLGASAVSAGVFVGSAIMGNEAHKEYRNSVGALVRGNFQESERAASRSDELGAVNGEPYQARSLAWRAAVGAVILSSVSVQAVASAAAAGSVQDMDLGAVNSMSIGTKNAIYQQMDNDPAGLDNDRSLKLASNFANTGDYSVEFVDPNVWDVESGLPKMTEHNQQWVDNLKSTVSSMSWHMSMGSNETEQYPATGDFFADSHNYISDTWSYASYDHGQKNKEFHDMNWEDKVAILDKVIDDASAEARGMDPELGGANIGKNMQMLVWVTGGADGFANIQWPSEAFNTAEAGIPADVASDLDYMGANPLKAGENRAEHTMQQIILNLGANEPDDSVRGFVWDKYREFMGRDAVAFDMRDVPPSSMNANDWISDSYQQLSGVTNWTLQQGYETADDMKDSRKVLADLGNEYSRMSTEAKLSVVDQLIEEGRSQVEDEWAPAGVKNPSTNVILTLADGHPSEYNETPNDVKLYRSALNSGAIDTPEMSWQHDKFSQAVHKLALSESDPVVQKFLWDQVRDISGMDGHQQFQQEYDRYMESDHSSRASSVDHGTIQHEVVGEEISHEHSSVKTEYPERIGGIEIFDADEPTQKDFAFPQNESWIASSYALLYGDKTMDGEPMPKEMQDVLRNSLVEASSEYQNLSAVSKLAVLTAMIDKTERETLDIAHEGTPRTTPTLEKMKDVYHGSLVALDKEIQADPDKPTLSVRSDKVDDHIEAVEFLKDHNIFMNDQQSNLFKVTHSLIAVEKDPVVKEFLWNELHDLKKHGYTKHPEMADQIQDYETAQNEGRRVVGDNIADLMMTMKEDPDGTKSRYGPIIDVYDLSWHDAKELKQQWKGISPALPASTSLPGQESMMDGADMETRYMLDKANFGSDRYMSVPSDDLSGTEGDNKSNITDLLELEKKKGSIYETSNDVQEHPNLKELRENGASASEYLKAAYDINKNVEHKMEGERTEAVASNRICVNRKNRNVSENKIWNTDFRYRSSGDGVSSGGFSDQYAGMTWREKQQARRDAKAEAKKAQAANGGRPKPKYDFRSNSRGQNLCIDGHHLLEDAGELMEDVINAPSGWLQGNLDSGDKSQTVSFLVTPKAETKASAAQSDFERLSGSRDKNQSSERFVQEGGIGLQAAKSVDTAKKDNLSANAPTQKKQSTGRA